MLYLVLLSRLILSYHAGHRGNPEPTKPSPATSPKSRRDAAEALKRLRPKVKLEKVPSIKLGPRKPVTEEKAAQIKACVARLAEMDSPDFGLSATMSGEAFLPLPGQENANMMLLTNHHLKTSSDLKTLVAMGPDALPFLLDALSDKTPTKITITHDFPMGGMYFAHELGRNPGNTSEMKALPRPARTKETRRAERYIKSYTVKVGDVCFVAIGQIVGRGYQAVRYQPTACIVINSPTEDSELCEQVRKVWSSDNAPQKLLDSLLLDYATEGVFQGPSLDSWSLGSHLQVQAAMRLLYYYPEETAGLIAERLHRLDVKSTSDRGKSARRTKDDLDAFIRRELANGVRTTEFVKAISWCSEPKVREAIGEIFMRTTAVDVPLAALPGMENADRKIVGERLQTFLDAVPPEEGGAYGDGYNLLVALAEHLDKDAATLSVVILRMQAPSVVTVRRRP